MEVVRTWKTLVRGDLAGSGQSEGKRERTSLGVGPHCPLEVCCVHCECPAAATCWTLSVSGDSSRGEGSCGRALAPGPQQASLKSRPAW